MDYETVKKTADIQLDGCTVAVERHDNSVSTVTITDKSGHVLRITGSYGITVLVPKKPKTVTQHFVVGKVKGLSVDEACESEYEANRRVDDLGEVDGADVKVEKREMLEEVPF